VDHTTITDATCVVALTDTSSLCLSRKDTADCFLAPTMDNGAAGGGGGGGGAATAAVAAVAFVIALDWIILDYTPQLQRNNNK